MHRNLFILGLLFLVGCDSPLLGHKINRPPVPKKIQVIVSDDVKDCQIEALDFTMNTYSILWGTGQNEFEMKIMPKHEVLKRQQATVKAFQDWKESDSQKYWNGLPKDFDYRTIYVTFTDYPGPFGEKGCVEDEKCYTGWADSHYMAFNYWFGKVSIQSESCGSWIFAHEFGHVFYLDHSEDPNNLMYPFVPNQPELEQEQIDTTKEWGYLHQY